MQRVDENHGCGVSEISCKVGGYYVGSQGIVCAAMEQDVLPLLTMFVTSAFVKNLTQALILFAAVDESSKFIFSVDVETYKYPLCNEFNWFLTLHLEVVYILVDNLAV